VTDAKPTRAPIDWEAVEREYRAGQISVFQIGKMFGVSHTAINKRAAKEGWKRDLTERVRKEVSARLVSDEVSAATAETIVDEAAARGVAVVREHRVLIGRGKKLVAALFGELEEATEHREEIEDAIIEDTKDDKTMERRSRMLRAVALPTRAGTLKALADANRIFIGLDRQAFGLSDEADGDKEALTVVLRRFASANG